MDPRPRLREHHLFERMERTLLYNVATMVFYEVTPAVREVVVAVGHNTCVASVCDVDSSGKITAGDALRVLKKAVGTALELVGPAA